MNSSYPAAGPLRRVRLGVNDHGMLRLRLRQREAPAPPGPESPWPRRVRHHMGRWLENFLGE